MSEIRIATGSIDCHFEQNYAIVRKNMLEGRPALEGVIPSTLVPDPRFPDGYMIVIVDD